MFSNPAVKPALDHFLQMTRKILRQVSRTSHRDDPYPVRDPLSGVGRHPCPAAVSSPSKRLRQLRKNPNHHPEKWRIHRAVEQRRFREGHPDVPERHPFGAGGRRRHRLRPKGRSSPGRSRGLGAERVALRTNRMGVRDHIRSISQCTPRSDALPVHRPCSAFVPARRVVIAVVRSITTVHQ
jgi:hypothetical protein